MGMFTLRESGRARTHRTSSPASQAHRENRRGRRRHPLVFDRLEDRTVLSPTIFTVTGIGDSSSDPYTATSGDLRYCVDLADANTSNPDGTLIQFDPTVFSTPQTITLLGNGLTLSNTADQTTIVGPGVSSLTVSGGGPSSNFSVFTVNPDATVGMSGLRIANGNAGAGGGIANNGTATLTNVIITGNSSTGQFPISGGGIYNGGMVTLTNVTISNNSDSGYGGGGLFNRGAATLTNVVVSANSASNFGAGGIQNQVGTMTLTNVTISGNSASFGGRHRSGGGIENSGTATLSNVTISGNSASFGGGIENSGTATLSNVTISGNSSPAFGGGIDNSGTATLNNTIVANSTSGGDISGSVSGFNNLIDDAASAGGLTNGVNGNIVGVEPLLAPLGNYGGSTQTMPLLPGSPAIGAGDTAPAVDAQGNPLTTDQRDTGYARTLHGMVDIGAFEDQISGNAPGSQNATQGVSGSFNLGAFADQATPATSWSVDVNWGDGSTLATDHQDYAPGATVNITGSGFGASETVDLQVLNVTTNTSETAWSIAANPSGNISTTVTVGNWVGDALQLNATGETSGSTAATTFTDTPTITTDRTAYAPGSTASITGAGWQAGETVNLQVFNVTTNTTESAWSSAANSSGAVSTTLVVGNWSGDTLQLSATGGTSGLTAQTTFTDVPTVATDQTGYAPGATANISGVGWRAGETVDLQVVDVTTGTTKATWNTAADPIGNISSTWTVANLVGDRLQLTATGVTSGLTGQTTFTDGPNLTTDQTAYAPSSTATITGAGWQAGETVNLHVFNVTTNTTESAWSAAANSSGAVSTTLVMGNWVGDTLQVTATGGTSGWTAATTFLAGSTITIKPTDNPPGSTASITGAGWQAGETVDLQVFNVTTNTNETSWTVPANSGGVVSTTLTVGSWVGDTLQLTATGETSGLTAETTFTDANNAGDGDGTMGVSPTSVTAGSTGNTLIFTFDDGSGHSIFTSGSQATIQVPADWTAPQTGAGAGHVAITSTTSGATASIASITGSGPWLITINFTTADNHEGFTLTYSNATAPSTAETSTFTTQTKQAGGTLTAITAGSPMVTVTAAATTTTTSVASSHNPSFYGQSVTFTATVTSTSTPTGSVDFEIDSGAPIAGTVGSTTSTTATWTYATSTLTVSGSPHTVEALFVATGGFADSNGTLSGGQTVDAAALTVTPNAVSTTFSGLALNNTTYSDSTGNYSITGFQNGQTITSAGITLSGSMAFNGSTSTTVENAGTYTQAVGTLALSSTNSNYSMTFSNPTPNNYVITAASPTINVTPYTVTYDATAHTATGTATGVGSVNLSGDLSLSGTTHTNAGTYSDTWTFTDPTGNYQSASGTVNDVINKATAVIAVITTADSGPGSLRQAIDASNASGGPNTIDFNIPGPGVHTISLASALPTITGPVIIDGYTQPGASPNTLPDGDNAVLLIELSGASAPLGTSGLTISGNGGGSTITGLVINGFKPTTAPNNLGGFGILLESNGNLIIGNFIGTDPNGTVARANQVGVHAIDSSQNTIGGTAVGARNVISGNIGAGVSIDPGATNNVVLGNFIGTDATGERAVPNSANGVLIDGSSNNTIGGTAVGARNVISGNIGAGVSIDPGATNNVVLGNFIGTDATGERAVPNSAAGVLIGQSSNNTIGGTAVGAGNVISYNSGNGVSFGSGATSNVVQGNVISYNSGAGVYFGLGATNNVVQGNVISGNIGGGVSGPGAANNVVQGNLIPGNGEPNLPPPNNPQPSILLVPAQSSSLALIATLVVTSLNGGESQIMSVGSGTASVLPTQATAPSGKGGEGAHAADESGNPLGGLSILIPPALRPWVLVLLGTNEALARIRGTIPDLFTSGDGQQGPVELLSRAYQAVVRTIDEAIPFLASQGDPISLAALPVPAVAWGIDEVASDLALEEPFQPQATPSAASAAADDVRHLGEVLARPTKLWRVGLVGGFITGSTVIAANAVRKAFQRHRR